MANTKPSAVQVTYTPSGSGAVATDVQSKLRESLSVKDFGEVDLTGALSAQATVSAAVAAAYLAGVPLYWPAGFYLTTGNISNFHSVRHYGPGAVKRGSDVFYISPSDGQTNTIYVSTTGSDNNDGLSSSQTKQTIQSGIDALSDVWRPSLLVGGVWTLSCSAGIFASGRFPDEGLQSRNPIRIIGANVGGHPNVPTTLIKQAATEVGVGLFIQKSTDLYVQDIKFEDFNGSTASAGISATNRCNVSAVNCHFEDCYIGLSGTEWCEIDVKGGVFNDCGYLNSVTPGGYGIRGLFHCKFSVGLQSAGVLTNGPFFTNNYFGVFGQELVTGHIDFCTFTGNNSAIRLSVLSRVNCDGSAFTSNGIAAWASDTSVISASTNTTFTGNTQNIILGGGSSSSGSPVLTNWSNAYGRGEYVVWGSKAAQTVNATTNTVIQSATLKGGMLSETYASLIPPKKIGFRLFGTLSGTLDIKRINLRLGASVSNITFTDSETGAFEAFGEVVLRSPGSQVAKVSGARFGGTGTRCTVTTMTEDLLVDTAFNLEIVLGNSADSVTIEYAEIFCAGI